MENATSAPAITDKARALINGVATPATPATTVVKTESPKVKAPKVKTLKDVISDAKAVRGNVRARVISKSPDALTEQTGRASKGIRKLTDVLVTPADAETEIEKMHLNRLALLAAAQRAIAALSKVMPADMPAPSIADILAA